MITGSHGILKIHDKPLYLDEENQAIPVPAEFFKIIIEPSTSAGIAVVCSNNPFLKNQPKDKLCEEDICKANKWPVMRSYTHGYCYCCDPMALDKDKLPFLTIPRVEQILQYAPFELKKKSHHQTNHHIDHPSHHYKPHHSHHYKHHHSHYSSNHHRTHHKYQPIPDWDDQLTASMVGTWETFICERNVPVPCMCERNVSNVPAFYMFYTIVPGLGKKDRATLMRQQHLSANYKCEQLSCFWKTCWA